MVGRRELWVPGLGPVGRVAAVFQIEPPLEQLPFANFKVKVLARGRLVRGGIEPIPLGPDGHLAWVSGLGPAADAALGDALSYLDRSMAGRT